MLSEDIIRVHLENPQDILLMPPRVTEEKEPEHFVFGTYVIANATGYDLYKQLLPEDPLRKDWSVMTVDQPIVLCHSANQAASYAGQVANAASSVTVPPTGAFIPAGSAFTFTGTGAVWIAATSATPTRVSYAANRRGSA